MLVEIESVGCEEKMIFLPDCLDREIIINLVNTEFRDERRLFLREEVVTRLNLVQKKLPGGYRLMIRDAFRTEEMVWRLFHKYLKEFIEEGLSRKKAEKKVRFILAVLDEEIIPGHMTGGAVDIILAHEDGTRARMEVPSSVMPRHEQAETFYAELPDFILKVRKILHDSMAKEGFHNCPREYWHYSYGDGYWAKKNNREAIYGIPQKDLFDLI